MILGLFSFFVVHPASVKAATISCSQGFSDSFDGTTIDTSKWTTATTSGTTVSQNGQINISINGGSQESAGLNSVNSISGDLDAGIDMISLTGQNTASSSLMIINSGGSKFVHVAEYVSGDGSRHIETTMSINGTVTAAAADISVGTVRFRIVRVGNDIKIYYKTDSDFNLLKDFNDGFTDDVFVNFYSGSTGTDYPAVTSSFDNFSLGCVTLSCSDGGLFTFSNPGNFTLTPATESAITNSRLTISIPSNSNYEYAYSVTTDKFTGNLQVDTHIYSFSTSPNGSTPNNTFLEFYDNPTNGTQLSIKTDKNGDYFSWMGYIKDGLWYSINQISISQISDITLRLIRSNGTINGYIKVGSGDFQLLGSSSIPLDADNSVPIYIENEADSYGSSTTTTSVFDSL